LRKRFGPALPDFHLVDVVAAFFHAKVHALDVEIG
jgi:hypothetical protein